jgi:plastocyanin
MRRTFGWWMAAGIAVGLAGCKPSDAVKHSQGIGERARTESPSEPPPSPPVDPATLGTVSGTVRFVGRPPPRVKIDMSEDPACAISGGDNFTEQYLLKDGKLANVFVYLKSGPPGAMSATTPTPAPVVMDQMGCKYVPHVVAVIRGGSVEFRNSDGTMHNIHTMPAVAGNDAVDVSQGAKGAPQVRQFKLPEVMMPVRCNNHPWMNAFINVSATPFYAVTNTDGHFGITGLPAGTYTLAVVHEKLGEQSMTVTVEPQKTAKADFSFSSK